MRARQLSNNLPRYTKTNIPINLDKTLVIIDMQTGFVGHEEKDIIPAICTLIRHAKESNWGIIVVEFESNGDTEKEITDMLINYPHFITVHKEECDGSLDIFEALSDLPQWSQDFLVCGLYGPECVAETVDGLLYESKLSEVTVVEDAVWPDYCHLTREDCDTEREFLGLERCEDDHQLIASLISVEEVVR